MGTASVDEQPYVDDWGEFYSAYSPVYNSEGKLAGIIGVDFAKKWYDDQLWAHTVAIFTVSVLSVVIGVSIIILFMSGVRRKLKQVRDELASLAEDVEGLTGKISSDKNYKGRKLAEARAVQAAEEQCSNGPDELAAVCRKIRTMQNTLKEYITYMNSQAYTDRLTGAHNSTAYYNAIERLDEKIKKGTAAFAVVVFDINGLKRINDDYGHAMGDSFIIDAFNIMAGGIGDERLYRVGGDEFIGIIEDATQANIDGIFADLDKLSEFFVAVDKPYKKASFSKGAAVFTAEKDKTFQDVFKRADQAMYNDKEAYYAYERNKRN